MTLYWATGWTALVSIEWVLKKDMMRNDNLFFKRVTDIIIPDSPLSIDT